jgi:hypothetical protein
LGLSPTDALHNVEAFARPPAVLYDEPESVSRRDVDDFATFTEIGVVDAATALRAEDEGTDEA